MTAVKRGGGVRVFLANAGQGPAVPIEGVDLREDVGALPLPVAVPPPQVVHFGGRRLSAGVPLAAYGVMHGSTLQAQDRLRGGAQLGKAAKGKSQSKPKEYADMQAKYAKVQEADEARQAAAAARSELRATMELEQKNSKTNQLKIQNQWRKIMRLAKVESLKKDIEILSQNHERDVDRKDAIVQMLDHDLEEAEDQFATALRSHLVNMDNLIDLHDARLLALEQAFEEELQTIRSTYATERDAIVAQHAEETGELTTLISVVHAQEEEREAEARQEHEQMREEIRNRNLEEINVLRITLDTQIEELEQHFETAHINYLQNTDQRTTDFKYLTAKDHELSHEIEIKIRRIERLQGALQHWRGKIAHNIRDNAQRNALLTEERNAIAAHYQKLKGAMNGFRTAQRRRLGELTLNAENAKAKLRNQVECAENILKLAELCRKEETEEEMVMPFYESAHTDAVKSEVSAAVKEDEGHMSAPSSTIDESGMEGVRPVYMNENGSPVSASACLEKFHKRYNKALLDKLAIEREELRLEEENAQLRGAIQSFLEGVSVSDEVLFKSNPLLVINGKVNIGCPTSLPVERAHRPVAMEASHLVATGRVNTREPL